MPVFRYILEKGSRKHICPECGKKTFVRYVDEITGEHLPERYGRCDRESKCSYHLNPYKDGYAKAIWEQDQGNKTDWKPQQPKRIKKPVNKPKRAFIPVEVFNRTRAGYEQNTFIQNLLTRVAFPFEVQDIEKVISLYHLGTVQNGYRKGANTFPFIDVQGNIRAVQVKQFDEQNHTTGTDFLHSIIEKHHNRNNEPLPEWLEAYNKNETKVSCLFGEHLLRKYPHNPVALVEAPKTAIYGALYFGMPQSDNDLIWLAVYNKSSLTFDKISALKGRTVFVFPDLSTNGSTFKEWQRKAKDFEKRLPGTRFVFSDLLERFAPEQDRQEGSDLADYLIRLDWRMFRQPAAPTGVPAPATATPTAAVTTTGTELHKPQPEEEHQTAPTPGTPETREQLTPIHTAHPATAPVTPERPTENKKAKPQDAIQPDQTDDLIIQPRTDYSEAEIIQAIERIDKGSNGRERLNKLIDEGKLHRCKITKAIYYLPF